MSSFVAPRKRRYYSIKGRNSHATSSIIRAFGVCGDWTRCLEYLRQYRDLKAVVGAIDAEQNTTAEDLSRLQQLSDQLRADSAHSGEILQRDKECLRLRTEYREPFTLPPKDEEGEKRRAEGVRALRAARGAVDRCQP